MQIMLVPGNGDADINSEIWYPWIRKELENLNLKIIAKNMPDADLARRKYWIPFIEEQLQNNKDSILIGHSSGALAALRYAEIHKLIGLVIVGASYTDLADQKEKASGYFDEEWHWEKIKQNVKWIIHFHSINDPFIPVEEARYIAKKLNTEYYEFNDQGHFSSDVDKNKFPELLKVLKMKLKL
ncbi:MAG: alpha/beta hydrolase [bacterium]|nr:alpha/beta hydrolase [bacterium]